MFLFRYSISAASDTMPLLPNIFKGEGKAKKNWRKSAALEDGHYHNYMSRELSDHSGTLKERRAL
jgi:hypothetical protein